MSIGDARSGVSSAGPAAVIVLAAGEGTRMRSATPKVLHEVGGRSLLAHAVLAARTLQPERLLVVVGHGREAVVAHLARVDSGAEPVVQAEQRGSADAVRCALDSAEAGRDHLDGTVVVTAGDVPLLGAETLRDLLAAHRAAGNAVTVLTAEVEDPTGYGRILRSLDAAVEGNVEERDASAAQRSIREINTGIYAFDAATLRDVLQRVGTRNAQGETYLPDALALARAAGRAVGAVRAVDAAEVMGVNDRIQLAEVDRQWRHRNLRAWMRAGVGIVDPDTTWVGADVTLEPDVVLRPGVHLEGQTSIGAGAVVGPDTTVSDSIVGEGATVVRSHLVGAQVGSGATVGPYAYLRPGAVLGPDAHVGTFVEVKGATLGHGTKVPHLSYVGDADVGAETNIGAATVFVNYDGVAKHRTTIGSHARTGADNMFVAPVTVGDGAYTAAGSVITHDVPPGAMAVARGRQRNIDGWVARRRAGTAAADAATRALAVAATDAGPVAGNNVGAGTDEGTYDTTATTHAGEGGSR